MSVLKGTNVNPAVVDSPIDQVEVVSEAEKKMVESLDEKLRDWEAFAKTREGSIIQQLTDPNIDHLNMVLALGIAELKSRYPALSGDDLNEYRAECRGALGVWRRIKYERKELERQLADLNGAFEARRARLNRGRKPASSRQEKSS